MKRLFGVVALALVLAASLAGCAGRGRVTPASAVPATTQHTVAPRAAARKSTAGTSQSGQLASVQQTLDGLTSTMTSIDSNITQADKAADSDQ